jgi:hypothetical protein
MDQIQRKQKNQTRQNQLKNNFLQLESVIQDQAKLIAVSKTFPFEDVKLAYELGYRDFGENRVDELYEKSTEAKKEGLKDIRWHFIGNLQSKKVNKLLKCPELKYIHSVDRIKILESLKLAAQEEKKTLKYFLQYNTSGESEKSGFKTAEELKQVELDSSYLKCRGLMTMSKIRSESFESDAMECFTKLIQIRNQLEEDRKLNLSLSMGMSSDYQIALNVGTDYLRLGSLIFGNRT